MNRQQRRASAKHSAKIPAGPRAKTPDALCEAGLALLRSGQPMEAENCGIRALAANADHAGSLHLMGMVCLVRKRYDLAVEWFARAIRQNPDNADWFSNLGMALQHQGRLDDSVKSYDRALQLDSSLVETWDRLGQVLQQQNRPDEAGKSYDRALQLKPELAETWFRLGQVLQQQGRRDEAVLSFDQALKINPRFLEAANSSGLLYFEAERLEEALARFEQSEQLQPGKAGVYCMKGICLLRLRRYDEALIDATKAFELEQGDAVIADTLACVLQKLGRHDEAVACFDKAIALRPDYVETLNHRGISLAELHRFDEAFASFDRSIAIKPDFSEPHWNTALFRLLIGDFAAGWAAREWGRKCRQVGFVDRQFDKPFWFGDVPIAGKTILLHSDEGLGDTIQFSRYASLVAGRGARVILEVQTALHALLSGIEGVSLCLPKSASSLPDFDLHCPLSSLPVAFGTRLETIPSMARYVPAPPAALVQSWQARLGSHDRLRVGLVWSGNPVHLNDHNRSISLRRLSAILDADASFISLQKDPRPDDKATLLARTDIVDLTEELASFVETAALISCLDLVITVDTSVAHLAGALARPTWILLPYTPDYRWLLDRDDSPWYPTVRLFRQSATREYGSVLERVRAELQALVAAFRPRTT
jgi:tetratricopeptide (TPR) repeat protein